MVEVGGVGKLGKVEVLQEERNHVGVPGGFSGGDVVVVTTVMVDRGANVPAVNCMCG